MRGRWAWLVEYRKPTWSTWRLHCGVYQSARKGQALGEIKDLQETGDYDDGTAFRAVRYERAK